MILLAALVFWVVFMWRWLQRDNRVLANPLDYFALALPAMYILSAFGAANKGWPLRVPWLMFCISSPSGQWPG